MAIDYLIVLVSRKILNNSVIYLIIQTINLVINFGGYEVPCRQTYDPSITYDLIIEGVFYGNL
jgi:hypothetical protein